ncbi:hypothetical protein FBU31_002025 [Coemansia sp. 'formosensis']|nr:hypothetical protein FBU31_002025 [Coemansia sp. 'formosensis']
MQYLSVFQLLPPHVVRLVVDHFVDSTRVFTYRSPLRWTDLTWYNLARAGALARFHCTKSVHLKGNQYEEDTAQNTPRCPKKSDLLSHYPVQEVHIHVDMQDVFYGETLEALSKAPCQGRSLRQVRRFKFHFHTDPRLVRESECRRDNPLMFIDRSESATKKYEKELEELRQRQTEKATMANANISEFVHRIKQLASMLREIEVDCTLVNIVEHPETEFFTILLAQLFQLTPHIISRIDKPDCPVDVPVDSIPNLVHIDTNTYSIGSFVQLARQSAATLQYLRIITYSPSCPSGLIEDINGDYVTYPQLRTLKLDISQASTIPKRLAFPGAIPFPNIRLLSIKGGYPFDDDVLFRGNATILECLVMVVGHDDIVKFLKRGVFMPTSHPKLQCVKILYLSDRKSEYLQLLLNIAPNAVVRGVFNCGLVSNISSAISVFSNHPNIQVLDMPGVSLGLEDVIALIQSLPLLSDLHSDI